MTVNPFTDSSCTPYDSHTSAPYSHTPASYVPHIPSQPPHILPTINVEKPPPPQKIRFKGKNYIITTNIFTQPKETHIQSIAFAELITMILRYAIPALEAEHKIEIISLNGLKLYQKVEQDKEEIDQGKLYIKYSSKNKTYETEITHDLELLNTTDGKNSTDQQKVCKSLDIGLSQCCHTHHNTVKNIYTVAIKLLTTDKVLLPTKISSYTNNLELINYEQLPKSFKEKFPKDEKSDSSPTSSQTLDSKQDTTKSVSYSKEPKGSMHNFSKNSLLPPELVWDNIPSLIIESSESTTTPKWKEYLLNGKLTNEKGENVQLTYKPIIFTETDAARILKEIRYCRKHSFRGLKNPNGKIRIIPFRTLDFDQFSEKDQVFIKRLILLLTKTYARNLKKSEKEKSVTEPIISLGIAIINDKNLYDSINIYPNDNTLVKKEEELSKLNYYFINYIYKTASYYIHDDLNALNLKN